MPVLFAVALVRPTLVAAACRVESLSWLRAATG